MPPAARSDRDRKKPALAEVRLSARQAGTVALLRTVLRNPLEIVPQAAVDEFLIRARVFGRDSMFLCDPDMIGHVLTDEADAFIKADSMRRALAPALGDAILTAEGDRWRWQRRAAAPIFRHERILGMAPAMLEAAAACRDRLFASRPGGEVDVAHEMMRTTFAIIVETMLSGRARIDVDRVERGVTDYLEGTSWAVMFALLRAPRWTPCPGQVRALRARDYLRRVLLELAAERRRNIGEERNDLPTLLLRARDPQTGQAMSDRDVADNLLTFVTAGHETTALALTWTLYLLSAFPSVADGIRREIADVAGAAALAPSHLEALSYTRAVVLEAMRLYPPAPMAVRTAVRDVTVRGERIAEGTTVTIPIYALHRHRALWEDPDAFDPERFRPEAAKARHRYAYLPFGAGPRVCIGMSFALLEAVAVLATIVRDLRPELRPDFVPELKMRITLRPARGVPMRFARVSKEPPPGEVVARRAAIAAHNPR